jgi:hypothetical protein
MTQRIYFQVNKPNVILETFEDEVVLINLDSGNYYSLEKIGAEIWKLIESGAALDEIVESVSRTYKGSRQDIERTIHQFTDELRQEGLIVQGEPKEGCSTEGQSARVENTVEAEKPDFEAPILHRCTDMQDLLLLDPIHEVDETGWPTRKRGPSVEKD